MDRKLLKNYFKYYFVIKPLESFFKIRYLFTKKNNVNYDEFDKIALICTSPLGYGDLIMDTPFIINFKRYFKDKEIHLITDKNIFDKVEGVDKIVLLEKGLKQQIKQIKSIGKNENYDLGIIMNKAINQTILLELLNPKYKLGYLYGWSIKANFYLKNENMRFDKNSHYWNMALNILLSLGFKPLEKRLAEVRYSKEVVKKAKDVFDSLELDNKPVIAINPFVAWPTRTWDKDNFVKLIEILHKNYNIILYGGPDAKKTEQYILNKLNKKGIKIKSVIGKLNLKESIYFLKFVDLFVTGDSGPMHFAFLMKTPTLALFGPVNPLHRLPIDFKKYKIFDYLWYCDYKPCKSLYNYEFEYTNKEMEGLKAIPVRDVIKKIEHFFNSNKRFY